MMKPLMMLGTISVVTAVAMAPAVAGPHASTPRPTAFGHSQMAPVSNFSHPTLSSARPTVSTRVPTAHSRPQIGTSSSYGWNGRTLDPLPGAATPAPTLTSGKVATETPQLSSRPRPPISTPSSFEPAVDPLPGGGADNHHVLAPTATAYDNPNVILRVDPPVRD